ncbi:MAG: universal stress protein [Flavitalea sp.]
MEKILFVVDHNGPDKVALDFACYIAALTRSKLEGIFIDAVHSHLTSHEPFLHQEEMIGTQKSFTFPAEPLPDLQKKIFTDACTGKGISWLNTTDTLFSSADIIGETRFADLLIVSGGTSSANLTQTAPSAFVREILSESECPVIIAPLDFNGIDEIILAYDGSESSMYAIKQFTYLFPQFSEERVIYLEVKTSEDHDITHQEKLGEFLKMHYSAVGYKVLHGNPGDQLFAYLLGKKNVLVVIGAYGRSVISTSWRKSTAELLLKTTSLPVFITHH